jgi:hypothetical protein
MRRQPYTHAKPATGRFLSGLFKAGGDPVPPTDPVNRDPCQRCGVRADIGCACNKARLGMVL